MYNYCNTIESFTSVDYDTDGDRLITSDSDDSEPMFEFTMGSSCPDEGQPELTNFNADSNRTNCSYRNTRCQDIAESEEAVEWAFNGNGSISAVNKRKECMKCVRGSQKVSGIASILSNAYSTEGSKPDDDDVEDYSNYTDFSGYICDAMVGCGNQDAVYAFNNTDWSTDCGGEFDTNKENVLNSLRCTLVDNTLTKFILSYMGGLTCTLEIEAIQALSAVEQAFNDMECAVSGGLYGENCG